MFNVLTDKGVIKVLDRQKKTAVATYREPSGAAAGSSGFYSVAVPAKVLPFHVQQAVSMGDRAPVAPPIRFAVTYRTGILMLDFQK